MNTREDAGGTPQKPSARKPRRRFLNRWHWRSLLAFWRRWRRRLSRREWSVKLFDVPVWEGASDEPGLVLLQIDGLARDEFERAIADGYLPFLRRLRQRERYQTRTLYSGQPATTPAVLGELFYGVEQSVPAFGFRDHRSGERVAMIQPEIAARVQDELAARGDGLLAGGLAYCDIYSGGAGDSSFCPATTGWCNLEDVSAWRRVAIFLLNLLSLIRIAALMLVEFVLAVADCLLGIVRGYEFWPEVLYVPRRVVVNVVLREYVSLSAEVDVTRGVPVLHANFLGYDENAHRRGPDSRFALAALLGIDRAIERIWKAAHASRRRDYHVWIMADHGQQRTIPYQQETGRDVEIAVADLYHQRQQPASSEELVEAEPTESPKDAEPMTVALGPLGYVYWPVPLADEDLETLAQRLVSEAKIPLVMAAVNKTVWAWNNSGRYHVPEEAAQVLAPDHPYLETVAQDLTRLCFHPDAGDLLISGWRNGQLPLSFACEHGAHAGPGPQETRGFVMASAEAPFPEEDALLRPLTLRQMVQTVLNKTPRARRWRPRPPSTLRLVTYNVHSCIGLDGRLSPSRIARVLALAEPDVIALQELDVGRIRTGFVDQAEQIARALEMELHFHPSFVVEEEQFGNAVLSRFPIKLVKAGPLPGDDRPQEPRGALWVEVAFNDARVQLLTTHLGLSPLERKRQIEVLLGPEWLGHPDCVAPVIFCGDLNAAPRSLTYRELARRLRDVQTSLAGFRPRATWASNAPFRRIDHVFVDPQLQVKQVEVPRTRLARIASDHLPLIVEMEVPIQAAMTEETASPIHCADRPTL